jgi:hypothetical protein
VRSRLSQPDANGSVVYFVRLGDHIKIGFTANLPRRLSALRNVWPLVDVLLTIPGGREMERTIHELLQEAKIVRELFRLDWRVSQFIDIAARQSLDRGLQWLRDTTPAARQRRASDERNTRTIERRKTRAEQDAYYAGLVADRKQRLGW